MHRKLESLFDRAGKLVLPRCPATRGTTRQEIVSLQIRIPARRRLCFDHSRSATITDNEYHNRNPPESDY